MKMKRQLCLLVSILVFLLVGCSTNKQKIEKETLVDSLDNYSGFTRVISQKEYAFNVELLQKKTTKEEITSDKVKEFMNKENALFYLGNKLEICTPYSYEALLYELESENELRSAKKKSGEVVYGVERFDPITFYEYKTSNLRIDIIEYLSKHADADLEVQAKAYFKAHMNEYKSILSIDYTLEYDGKTEQKSINRQELKSLEKTDDTLLQFLMSGEEQEVFEYENVNRGWCKATITRLQYEDNTYENNRTEVMSDYIEQEVLPETIGVIAQNNPLEFQE